VENTGRAGTAAFLKLANACPAWAEKAYEYHGEPLLAALRKAAASSDTDCPACGSGRTIHKRGGMRVVASGQKTSHCPDCRHDFNCPQYYKLAETPDPGHDKAPQSVGQFYTRKELTEGTFKTKETQRDEDLPPEEPEVQSVEDPRKLVRIISYETALSAELPADVTDAEREQLVAQGVAIRDDRTEDSVSRVFSEDPGVTVETPTKSGVYDVIMRRDGIQKCLVLLKPWGGGGPKSGSLVISLAEGHPFAYVEPTRVFATKAYGHEEFRKAVDSLPKAKEGIGETSSWRDRVILIDPVRGESTVPLEPTNKTERDGITAYDANTRAPYPSYGDDRNSDAFPCHNSYDGQLVVDNSETTRFRVTSTDLWASAGARVMKITNKDDFRLGTLSDLRSQMYTSLHKLAILRSGNDVVLHNNGGISRTVPPAVALVQLVQCHGMRPDVAQKLLKTAGEQRSINVYLKYANPYLDDVGQFGPMYDLPDQDQTWDTMAGESYGMQQGQQMLSPVEMPYEDPRQSEPLNYVDQNTLATLQNAAQTGQQDVFEVGSLKSMLRSMRDDQIMDRFLPPLAKALDATGRLLFQFYWHQEDFEDRYGTADMPELEDGLRNLFEGLGDIVIKLKEHTVDAYSDGEQITSTLTDIAGAS